MNKVRIRGFESCPTEQECDLASVICRVHDDMDRHVIDRVSPPFSFRVCVMNMCPAIVVRFASKEPAPGAIGGVEIYGDLSACNLRPNGGRPVVMNASKKEPMHGDRVRKKLPALGKLRWRCPKDGEAFPVRPSIVGQ